MACYIQISTAANAPISNNVALLTLVKFIGDEYKKRHSGRIIKEMSPIKAGMLWLNCECGKTHMKAIKRILFSENGRTLAGDDYKRWRFHKSKVVHILDSLHKILLFCEAPEDLKVTFNQLYCQMIAYYDIDRRGSDIVELPYRTDLREASNEHERSEKERKALKRILNSFDKYDAFYCGRGLSVEQVFDQ